MEYKLIFTKYTQTRHNARVNLIYFLIPSNNQSDQFFIGLHKKKLYIIKCIVIYETSYNNLRLESNGLRRFLYLRKV